MTPASPFNPPDNPPGPDAYGVLTEPATLTLKRLLPGPIERVWAYLTDSDLRGQWLAQGAMDMKVGAPFEFVWRNDELSNPPSQRPPGFAAEHRMQCRITGLDAPRHIAFTWQGSGDVSFDLAPQGDQVLLTVTHQRVPDRDTLLKVSAGWHMHLDLLVARTTGQPPAPFWDGWTRLHQEYGQRLPG